MIGAAVLTAASIYSLHHVQAQDASPIYNPYPRGILPPDLSSEIARVQREVDVIESRALAQSHALPPRVVTGQPPTLQNTGTEAKEDWKADADVRALFDRRGRTRGCRRGARYVRH